MTRKPRQSTRKPPRRRGRPADRSPAPKTAAPAGQAPAAAAPPLRLKPQSFARRALGFAARWCAVAAIWIGIAVGAVVGWYAIQLPPIDTLEDMSRRPTVTVLAGDGSMLANYGDLYGTPYAVKDLPAYLPRAVIAIEDRRFYSHFGVDLIGLVRAAWVNHRSGRVVQGGSTLTQQLAKNLFLTNERSFKRKVQEVLLALWLEHRYSKDQLLAIYLNRVYLGAGAYGVDAAARLYFGKPATQVRPARGGGAGRPLEAPVRFSPARDPERAAGRAEIRG
ncbi:MAG: biosynthetic peptidoglycan transglycosylase [Pseudomonadota bacterium]